MNPKLFNTKSSVIVIIVLVIFCLLSISLFEGCTVYTQKRKLHQPSDLESIDKNVKFLKAHMFNGNVYILNNWNVDSAEKIINGQGQLLNLNRELMSAGSFSSGFTSKYQPAPIKR